MFPYKKLTLALLLTIGVFAGDRPALGQTNDASKIISVNQTIPAAITDVLKPSEVKVFGTAPGAHWQVIKHESPRSFLIVLAKNDELFAALTKFAEANKIKGASFSAIGAVGSAALGFYQRETRSYLVTKVPKQVEVAALSGSIGRKEGKYVIHAHGVLSTEDCHCLGGHFFYVSAWPTIEVMLTETDADITKSLDVETGLSLFDKCEL